MSIKTDYLLKALHVISWIIFIGLCIEAGGFLVNAVMTILLKPEAASKFWMEVDLSELYRYNDSHFITVTSLMVIVSVLRAILFYRIVKLFHDKKFDLSQPFNEATRGFIQTIAYLALGVGLFSYGGAKYALNLIAQGVAIPDLYYLRLGGADVWIFMGIILLIIASIFKKGIELQTENDLTV
ncbi:DUF2975 domain-containing protein [Algoriphagus aquimarinus]|uniref:DUF2975 domain-containing protein n=1 Tax=Algoriphagus aquimarinus TaxID=237018 RepID=A0A1I1BSE3_9BACT|nr:DUF2975 domain-containing protein [Algoriphagus aquimarinus]SFB52606.1 Protein of unknown function [Algoriphagus aquimarinus]